VHPGPSKGCLELTLSDFRSGRREVEGRSSYHGNVVIRGGHEECKPDESEGQVSQHQIDCLAHRLSIIPRDGFGKGYWIFDFWLDVSHGLDTNHGGDPEEEENEYHEVVENGDSDKSLGLRQEVSRAVDDLDGERQLFPSAIEGNGENHC